MNHVPLKQRSAREQAEHGVTIPYFVSDLDKPIVYHLKLLLLTPEELDKLVLICRRRAAELNPNPNDKRNGNLNYDPSNKERHSVVRHCLLNRTPVTFNTLAAYTNSYDNLLSKIERKGIDVTKRQMQLRRHICALINTYYPELAMESADYLWRYERKLGL